MYIYIFVCFILPPILFAAIAAFNFSLKAEGFSAVNADGVSIYYNILDSTARTVEVYNLINESDDDFVYKYSGAVNIPATVSYNGNSYSVTSIGKNAFRNSTSLTSVTIPDGVTSIGLAAFMDCTSLTSITLPNSLKEIGSFYTENETSYYYGAFQNCIGLTNITIPSNVTSIGDATFDGCSGITNITIPEGVTSIGRGAFQNCTGSTNITIPNGITSIENYTFDSCVALTNITIPESVTNIGMQAFYDCSSLTNITIPKNVLSIGKYAFWGSTSLSTLTFNADSCADFSYLYHDYYNDKDYDKYSDVFTDCPLTNVTIGDNVKRIPALFMYNQEGITNITIPESVTSIGNGAFWGSTSLSTLTFNAANCADFELGRYKDEDADYWNYYIYYAVLQGCPLTNVTIGDNVKRIPADFIRNQDSITNITIPNNVTSIGEDAFYGCAGITNITIPESVMSIGNSAFEDCTGITSITIQEGVTSIGDAAFGGCTGITSITVPESVTSIGGGAFMDCTGITSIIIQEGVTSIGEYAFGGCTGITSITVPESVTSIGENAFYGCNLHYINIKNGNAEVDATILCENMELDTLIAPASVFKYDEEDAEIAYTFEFYTTNKLKYLHINGGEITDNAFSFISKQKKSMRTVKMGDCTNTELVAEAFDGFYLMDTLVLPANLEKISYMSIANCMSLKNIEISSQITEIDDRAFENCRMLNTVTFEENGALERIGNWAFFNCHDLRSVAIPDGVTEVGEAAFYGCTYLENVILPASMTTIDDNAFALCAKMKSMSVKAIVPPEIEAKTFENVDRTIPVYVPDGSVADYKAHIYWKEFNIIGENEVPTSADIVEEELSFMQNGNTIVFAEEQEVKVFTMGGICIFSGMATEVNIEQAGVYVVVTATAATKVIIP